MYKKGDWVWAIVGRKLGRHKVHEVYPEDNMLTLDMPGIDGYLAYESMSEVAKAKPPLKERIRNLFQCG